MSELYKETVVIKSAGGLTQDGPAQKIVAAATPFKKNDISIYYHEPVSQIAACYHLYRLQGLDLPAGKTVTVSASGDDAKKAVQTIVKLIESITE
ncbi:hypothetical protein CYY_006264 [Polysphondylium violaceum]|uniref:HPr domain-containing protein n=1 Tax=Polysphondylium violaceum TaxID=133409 RepID=A0A8J4PSG1_9MYCE|nr:hypothetical protein CYY_006264 [Polysphondylium violaceum]